MTRTGGPSASAQRGWIGIDVGGANTKAVRIASGRLSAASRPFEIWCGRNELSAVIRGVLGDVGYQAGDAVAMTTTAELSDAFALKREGVAFVIDATRDALGGCSPLVLTTAGELLPAGSARERPLEVAAANWIATALEIAAGVSDALMIDVGSTTADVIPIARGEVVAAGRTDLDRLLAGELVYTGVLRTNLATVCPRVPVHGRLCPVSSELFAVTGDVHLVLGNISAPQYDCPTPDGRPVTVENSRARIARLVCADLEQLEAGEPERIARHIQDQQVAQIERAARLAGARCASDAPVVAVGSGSCLARAAARRVGRPCVPPPGLWGTRAASLASAAALATLLARRRGDAC